MEYSQRIFRGYFEKFHFLPGKCYPLVLFFFVMRTKKIGKIRAQTIVKRRLTMTPSNYAFGNIMIEQSLSFIWSVSSYIELRWKELWNVFKILKCLKRPDNIIFLNNFCLLYSNFEVIITNFTLLLLYSSCFIIVR